MMLVDLVALPPPPLLPPPPVILSLIPEAAPLSPPSTGLSPLAVASPAFAAALPIGPPSPMSVSLSVRPLSLSLTVSRALSPRFLRRSWPDVLQLVQSICLVGHRDQLLEPEPERERPREVDFLAADFFAEPSSPRTSWRRRLLGGRLLRRAFLRRGLLGGRRLLGGRLLRRSLLRRGLLGGRRLLGGRLLRRRLLRRGLLGRRRLLGGRLLRRSGAPVPAPASRPPGT